MWIEVFKTGTHTDSTGNSTEYSAESLDEIAKTYNTRLASSESQSAPLVKGHPKTNDPAFGWVERLARRGESLYAKIKNLNPELAGEVRQGKYRKVSIALYPDKMLRHIGLLGAVPPAVKGLAQVSFADDEEILVYESDELSNNYESAAEQADGEELKTPSLEEENLKLQREIALLRKESRLKAFRDYSNSLIENPEGSLITPSQAQELVDILEMAYSADSEFSETELETQNSPNVDKIKRFFSGLQPVISFSEYARGKSIANNQDDPFSGKKVAPDRLALHRRAKEIQSDNPGLSYEEAVVKAQREE